MAGPYIGVSGWRYKEWRGRFYPDGLVQRRELAYVSERMNSIEINGSFYSLQNPASYLRWHEETPGDFLFAVKGSKYITHQRRLTDVRVPLANFFASGILLLGKKLGPILWQFPPWEKFDAKKFTRFLRLLPKSSAAAARLAAENTIPIEAKRAATAVAKTQLSYAFEVRHPSFFTHAFVELLREYNAAFVFADTAGKWPYTEDLTADFMYIRLHGAEELYTSDYTEDQLAWWADRIRKWRRGKQPRDAKTIAGRKAPADASLDVFVYFDNDINAHAPFNAIRLAEMLASG